MLFSHNPRHLLTIVISQVAEAESVRILTSIAIPVKLSDRETLIKMASTSLNSKVIL